MSFAERHSFALKRTLKQFGRNHGMAEAGNMAFLAMLSLFPFIIFLVALSGFLGQTDTGLAAINFLYEVLPPEVSSVIDGPIQGIIANTGPRILTGSILFAIWTAALGVEAARDALIKAFGRQNANPAWIRRLESLAIIIFGAGTIIIAMSIQILGPPLLVAAGAHVPDFVTDGVEALWGYLSLLVSPAIIMLGLYAMFLALTPRKVENASRLPGTIFTLLVLLATAKGLSVYLRYVDNYDLTYGSLAGVVILQLFCFFVSIGFVIGAEMNAAYTVMNRRRRKIQAGTTNVPDTEENAAPAAKKQQIEGA